jgi:hypothetical protein
MVIIKNTSYTPVAEGQTGLIVAGIINDSQSIIYGTERYQFTQSDIISYNLNHVHNKGIWNVKATLYDNNGIEQLTAGLFTRVSANEWNLSVPNVLTGTWELIVTYLP